MHHVGFLFCSFSQLFNGMELHSTCRQTEGCKPDLRISRRTVGSGMITVYASPSRKNKMKTAMGGHLQTAIVIIRFYRIRFFLWFGFLSSNYSASTYDEIYIFFKDQDINHLSIKLLSREPSPDKKYAISSCDVTDATAASTLFGSCRLLVF